MAFLIIMENLSNSIVPWAKEGQLKTHQLYHVMKDLDLRAYERTNTE